MRRALELGQSRVCTRAYPNQCQDIPGGDSIIPSDPHMLDSSTQKNLCKATSLMSENDAPGKIFSLLKELSGNPKFPGGDCGSPKWIAWLISGGYSNCPIVPLPLVRSTSNLVSLSPSNRSNWLESGLMNL